MNIHKNARLTPKGPREILISRLERMANTRSRGDSGGYAAPVARIQMVAGAIARKALAGLSTAPQGLPVPIEHVR